MIDAKNADLLAKLIEIRKQIIDQIDPLKNYIDQFLKKDKENLSARSIEDINTISEGCSELLNQLSTQLSEENITAQINQGVNLDQYLSKIRHDLHNSINIIQGYGELVLIEFQKEQATTLVIKFSEIISFIKQIIRLADEIKLPQSAKITLDKYENIIVKQPIEVKEYQDFKEKISILIVDDQTQNCQLLERYLQEMGYENISIAHDGAQALNQLTKKSFNLVLLDLSMPGMSGKEVLVKLKKDIDMQRLMVLIITGFDEVEQTVACLKLGAEDLILKPFNQDLLRIRINACVEKKWYKYKENLFRYQLEFARRQFERLLQSIFPPFVVDELIKTGGIQTREYKNVAILVVNLVHAPHEDETHEPKEIIEYLQKLADMGDAVAIKYNVQKIKAIGGGFLGAAGMLLKSDSSVLDCIKCAHEMFEQSEKKGLQWKLNAGIHYGSVVGGMVGHRQYSFDIWGEAVNVCTRIQALAKSNTIYLSNSAWEQVKGVCEGVSLGQHEVKEKTPIEIFEYRNFRK